VRKDLSRTLLAGADAAARIGDAFNELEREALSAMVAEGVSRDAVTVRRLADVRYAGQSFELRVPAADWAEAFHDAHEARYGFTRRAARVELVTARVEAVGPSTPTPPRSRSGAADSDDGSLRRVRVYHGGQTLEAVLVPRSSLAPGDRLMGPAVVHEYSATLWLPDGWIATALDAGGLRLMAQ
jgi:N-methylhydantoinase A